MDGKRLVRTYRRALTRYLLARTLHEHYGWAIRAAMQPRTVLSLSRREQLFLSLRVSLRCRRLLSLMGCATIGECWRRMGVEGE